MPTEKAAMAKHIEFIHSTDKYQNTKKILLVCVLSGTNNAILVEIDKHMMISTREDKFSCEQCGKALPQNFLQHHTVTIHIPVNIVRNLSQKAELCYNGSQHDQKKT